MSSKVNSLNDITMTIYQNDTEATLSVTFYRHSTAIDEDEDPYAWLSKTAPPSPGYGKKSTTEKVKDKLRS